MIAFSRELSKSAERATAQRRLNLDTPPRNIASPKRKPADYFKIVQRLKKAGYRTESSLQGLMVIIDETVLDVLLPGWSDGSESVKSDSPVEAVKETEELPGWARFGDMWDTMSSRVPFEQFNMWGEENRIAKAYNSLVENTCVYPRSINYEGNCEVKKLCDDIRQANLSVMSQEEIYLSKILGDIAGQIFINEPEEMCYFFLTSYLLEYNQPVYYTWRLNTFPDEELQYKISNIVNFFKSVHLWAEWAIDKHIPPFYDLVSTFPKVGEMILFQVKAKFDESYCRGVVEKIQHKLDQTTSAIQRSRVGIRHLDTGKLVYATKENSKLLALADVDTYGLLKNFPPLAVKSPIYQFKNSVTRPFQLESDVDLERQMQLVLEDNDDPHMYKSFSHQIQAFLECYTGQVAENNALTVWGTHDIPIDEWPL